MCDESPASYVARLLLRAGTRTLDLVEIVGQNQMAQLISPYISDWCQAQM